MTEGNPVMTTLDHADLLVRLGGAEAALEAERAETQRLRYYLRRTGNDPNRCSQFPKGEQCCLVAGHAGTCRWAGGD